MTEAIIKYIVSLVEVYGVSVVIFILLGIGISWLLKKYIEAEFQQEIKGVEINFQQQLERLTKEIELWNSKNLQLWFDQKALLFEFVSLLDEELFLNTINPSTPQAEQDKIIDALSRKTSLLYWKIYLLLPADILVSINLIVNWTVSDVQRYYVYRQVRKYLLGLLYPNIELTGDQFPYVSVPVSEALFSIEKPNVRARTFAELKTVYPFIEQWETLINWVETYKALPYFGRRK